MASDIQERLDAASIHHASIHHLPADTTVLLQCSSKLWAASDAAALVDAAGELLQYLVPGTTIKRCPSDGGAPGAPDRHALRIELPHEQALLIGAPAQRQHDPLLHAAVHLIRVRVHALDKQLALTESVDRLGRSERLQRALYAIAYQASAADSDLTTMYRALHAIVGTLMYAENFFIAMYDRARDAVSFAYFADCCDPEPNIRSTKAVSGNKTEFPTWPMAAIEHGPTWYVIRDGKALMGSEEAMAAQVSGPFNSSGADAKDWLGVPLLHDREVVGCVAVQSYEEARQYTVNDKSLLTFVAQHIQTALERRFAHVELENRVNERTGELRRQVEEREHGEQLQAALFRIAELASNADTIEEFYQAVHGVVGGLLYAVNFYIALLSDDGQILHFPYRVDEYDTDNQPRKLRNGLTEYVLQHGTLLADATNKDQLLAEGLDFGGAHSVCWLGVPLVCDDRTVGVIAIQSYSSEHHYTRKDQELLTFVSYHIANALERKRTAGSLRDAYETLESRVKERTRALALANRDLRSQIAERERVEARLKFQTLHDSLTGLPNRALMLQRLDRALERYHDDPEHSFAVLFMDLDRFKVINDSVGHLVGDDLLIAAGERISSCLKPKDAVARLGGDEFSVLLEDVSDPEHARHVAERVINKMNVPFRITARELFTSASVGITMAAPHYQSSEELLRDADSAMYRAKSTGRRRCVLFDDELRREAVSLVEMERDLRRGLKNREFVPYYQPIVDLKSGHAVGYEALMRWHHPERGVLLPGAFLPVAEDTGVIEFLDWELFEQVCRDANALAHGRDIFVSINVSAQHFRNPQLDQRLLRMLKRYDVPPARLHVEVTEGALLENTPEVRRILHVFRDNDIGISLDDFGTGYSSLAYLHQYPLQTLKIDRSFVADLTRGDNHRRVAMIQAILAMAETLSMPAIAEGVETPEQRDLLRAMGCPHAQGFLYSKAQPLDTWTRETRLVPS